MKQTEYIIEWKMFDDDINEEICGGGYFSAVYTDDYNSAVQAVFAEQVDYLQAQMQAGHIQKINYIDKKNYIVGYTDNNGWNLSLTNFR